MFLRWKLPGKLSLRFLASLSRVVLEIFVLESSASYEKKEKEKEKEKGRERKREEDLESTWALKILRKKRKRNHRQLILRFVLCHFYIGMQWKRIEKLHVYSIYILYSKSIWEKLKLRLRDKSILYMWLFFIHVLGD